VGATPARKAQLVAGQPEPLLEEGFGAEHGLADACQVSPDGERFLVVKSLEGARVPRRLVHVPNWFEELKRVLADTSN